MYVVCCNDPPLDFRHRFFPRKVRYLKDAKELAKEVIAKGSQWAWIEYPSGARLDFRPPVKPARK